MKKLLFILLILPIFCFSQKDTWAKADSMNKAIDSSIVLHNAWAKDIVMVRGLTLEGLKAIRHDALCRLKFRHAHRINKLIKTY